MSRTAPLFDRAALPPSRRGVLADLDPQDVAYERLAAKRIAELKDLAKVDVVFAEVPAQFVKTVMTLAISGIAVRIARMKHLLDRRDALDALPDDIRQRAEPFVKSFYQTRPWERKPRRERK